MAQLTLNIADNKINFFLDLIKKFDFIKIEEDANYIELSQQQKDILNERLENYQNNPDTYIDIEDIKDNINKKYGF